MPYCSSCGNELRGDVRFCAECGQPVPEPVGGVAAVPVPPPLQPVGAYSPPPPPPPMPPFPGARRRSRTWLWIGGAAAVVVIAVVCVLVLVVFKGGGDQKTSDAKAAEHVVRQLLTAMEKQDVEALFTLMDPTLLGALPEGETRKAAIAAVKAELGTLGKMKFSGIEMQVEITSPTTATVTLTAGKATITDTSGKTTTEDIKDSSTPSTMDLVKQNGKWYIATSFFQ